MCLLHIKFFPPLYATRSLDIHSDPANGTQPTTQSKIHRKAKHNHKQTYINELIPVCVNEYSAQICSNLAAVHTSSSSPFLENTGHEQHATCCNSQYTEHQYSPVKGMLWVSNISGFIEQSSTHVLGRYMVSFDSSYEGCSNRGLQYTRFFIELSSTHVLQVHGYF